MIDPIVIFLIVIIVLALLLVKNSLVIIPQSETKIIERLGKYYATLKPGINVIIPFIDRAKSIVAYEHGRYRTTNSIDLREQVYDFDKQNVITKDNVLTQINALLYFQIMDPFKAVYEINNLPNAIEKLTQTTLRNIIGELELDQQAMEKQMQAERNKRATILTSEGQKQAAILQSEGQKTARINQAEADKQTEILRAEGEAQARIRRAEAEAIAIDKITQAVGQSTNPANYLLAQKYIQMLDTVASGDKTKTVYLPYEATNLLGSIGGIKDLFSSDKKE